MTGSNDTAAGAGNRSLQEATRAAAHDVQAAFAAGQAIAQRLDLFSAKPIFVIAQPGQAVVYWAS
jgi:hypothetical protein